MKAKIYGVFLLVEAFFMFVASMVALYYHVNCGEQDVVSLLAATMITGIFGFILLSAGREKAKRNNESPKKIDNLTMKDSFVVVTVAWVLFAVFGMLPFIFTGAIDNVTDAFFESMSGFTTTGSTIMDNIDAQPHGILFWRSMTQWLCGLGIIVLFLAIIPVLNKNSNLARRMCAMILVERIGHFFTISANGEVAHGVVSCNRRSALSSKKAIPKPSE